MVNASSIVPERIYIAQERGTRNGIRENRENRLSADDSTIIAYGSREQCSVWTKPLFGMHSKKDYIHRRMRDMHEKG